MAISEKFVSSAGSGSGDGSTAGNAMAWTAMVTQINAGGTAGNRYNVLGPISRGATDTISGSGTATSPVIVRGYLTTIGDGYLGRTNGNGPLITTNMAAITYASTFLLSITGSWILVESLNVVGTVNGRLALLTADSAITRCVVDNANTGANAVAIALSTRSTAFNCDATLSGGSGGTAAIDAIGSGGRAVCCRVNGGPAIGIRLNTTRSHAVDNLIFACAGLGLSIATTGFEGVIHGNTIADGSSDGLDIVTGTTGLVVVTNNLITDNIGYGIDGVSSANAIFAANNRMDRNSGGATNMATDWLAATSYNHELTSVLVGAEYTDHAARDYRLVSTSPAKGAGMFAYRDVGALQREEAAGGVVGGKTIVQNIGTY